MCEVVVRGKKLCYLIVIEEFIRDLNKQHKSLKCKYICDIFSFYIIVLQVRPWKEIDTPEDPWVM